MPWYFQLNQSNPQNTIFVFWNFSLSLTEFMLLCFFLTLILSNELQKGLIFNLWVFFSVFLLYLRINLSFLNTVKGNFGTFCYFKFFLVINCILWQSFIYLNNIIVLGLILLFTINISTVMTLLWIFCYCLKFVSNSNMILLFSVGVLVNSNNNQLNQQFNWLFFFFTNLIFSNIIVYFLVNTFERKLNQNFVSTYVRKYLLNINNNISEDLNLGLTIILLLEWFVFVLLFLNWLCILLFGEFLVGFFLNLPFNNVFVLTDSGLFYDKYVNLLVMLINGVFFFFNFILYFIIRNVWSFIIITYIYLIFLISNDFIYFNNYNFFENDFVYNFYFSVTDLTGNLINAYFLLIVNFLFFYFIVFFFQNINLNCSNNNSLIFYLREIIVCIAVIFICLVNHELTVFFSLIWVYYCVGQFVGSDNLWYTFFFNFFSFFFGNQLNIIYAWSLLNFMLSFWIIFLNLNDCYFYVLNYGLFIEGSNEVYLFSSIFFIFFSLVFLIVLNNSSNLLLFNFNEVEKAFFYFSLSIFFIFFSLVFGYILYNLRYLDSFMHWYFIFLYFLYFTWNYIVWNEFTWFSINPDFKFDILHEGYIIGVFAIAFMYQFREDYLAFSYCILVFLDWFFLLSPIISIVLQNEINHNPVEIFNSIVFYLLEFSSNSVFILKWFCLIGYCIYILFVYYNYLNLYFFQYLFFFCYFLLILNILFCFVLVFSNQNSINYLNSINNNILIFQNEFENLVILLSHWNLIPEKRKWDIYVFVISFGNPSNVFFGGYHNLDFECLCF